MTFIQIIAVVAGGLAIAIAAMTVLVLAVSAKDLQSATYLPIDDILEENEC